MSVSVTTSRVEVPTPVVEIAWAVSPSALQRLIGASMAGDDATLRLAVSARRDGSGVTLVCAGSRVLERREHDTGSVVITHDSERGFEHVDVQGVLSCSLRAGEVVFARAPILGRLGVQGGRYVLAPTKDAER